MPLEASVTADIVARDRMEEFTVLLWVSATLDEFESENGGDGLGLPLASM